MFHFLNEHRALVDIKLLQELSFDMVHRGSFESFARKLAERSAAEFFRLETAFKERLAVAKGMHSVPECSAGDDGAGAFCALAFCSRGQ